MSVNNVLAQLSDDQIVTLLNTLTGASAVEREDKLQIERIACSFGLPPQGSTIYGGEEALNEKIRCETSLGYYAAKAFEVLEPGVTWRDNWHIQSLCNHLDGMRLEQIKHLIVNVPPGSSKSIISSVIFPSWVWIHDPTMKFFFISYDQKLSTRDSVKCRSLIESDWYQNHWSSIYHLDRDANQKTQFSNSRGGWRVASSVAGGATGWHPNYLICDDPNNARKGLSEQDQISVNDLCWDQTLSSRGRLLPIHHRLVIQQRVHPNDLTGHILKKAGGDDLHLPDKYDGEWEHLRMPMRYEPELRCQTSIFEDPRTEENELLWPSLYSQDVVTGIEIDMGPLTTAGQLQQRPTVAGGTFFRSEWLKLIDPLPEKWLEPLFRYQDVEKKVFGEK